MTISLDLERVMAKARMLGRNRALAERASNFDKPQDSPLSGEWADDPTPSDLAAILELTDPDLIEEACNNYESSYFEAWEEGL